MTELITVTEDTLDRHGFFCKMSARKSKAWQDKRRWLRDRFAEGLQLRLLGDKERGFIEFMPAQQSWRAVDQAEGYLMIHCLWVVGKSKGKGYSRLLLQAARDYATEHGFNGLAALTSRGNWLFPPSILDKHGFETIETEGDYALQVLRFADVPPPRLCGDWTAKAAACGSGLTVLRSAQCPYLEDAASHAHAAAETLGLPYADRILTSAEELRALSPTPYGVYALVLDGEILSPYYLLEKQILKAVEARRSDATVGH